MDEHSLQTIIHLARKWFSPIFETDTDKVVFSVLCFFYGKGCRLVAFGELSDDSKNTKELDDWKGWNSNKTVYQFKLIRAEDVGMDNVQTPLLLKCLSMGEDKLLVSWTLVKDGESLQSREVSVKEFAGENDEVLINAQALINLLAKVEKQQQQPQKGNSSPAFHVMDTRVNTTPIFNKQNSQNRIDPLRVGKDDLDPFGGLEKDTISGNRVGPNHPIFRRQFGNDEGVPDEDGILPPGARFDYIGPPGMQGSHPGDYVPGRRRGTGSGGFPSGLDNMFM
eukprot:TRINITY_DN8424_c0_g1_i10.p1 TRINITY_DN8424_c0_g1~~TRINITY_DN8424_c0_g1_i10.p1  ORF type:complete len:280 (-),score=56.16 TRINITY_DN8424_c0_g1_i10:386-1225(-)